MPKELFILCLTMLSIALAILNFIALSNLKERQGFQKEVPKFIKVIILLPPLGLVYYFAAELTDFFNDYFKKQNNQDDDLPF